jgi:hypothetical protein
MPKIRKRQIDTILTSLANHTTYHAHVFVFIYLMGVYVNAKFFDRNRLIRNSVIDAEKPNYTPLRC